MAAANGTDKVQDAQAEVLDVGRDGTADQNWTQATATAQQNESDAESSAYQTLSQNTAALDAAFQNYEANSDAQTIAGLDPASTPWGKLAIGEGGGPRTRKGVGSRIDASGDFGYDYHMPRRLSATAGGIVYHVLNRGVGRMRLFRKAADFAAMETGIGGGGPAGENAAAGLLSDVQSLALPLVAEGGRRAFRRSCGGSP